MDDRQGVSNPIHSVLDLLDSARSVLGERAPEIQLVSARKAIERAIDGSARDRIFDLRLAAAEILLLLERLDGER